MRWARWRLRGNWARWPRSEGSRSWCCAPSLVYGPGDSHRQYGPSALARGWREGEVFLYGEGDDERDFVYVDDVARITADLVEGGASGVFNVSGESASFRRILEILARLDPRPVRIVARRRKLPLSRVSFDASRLRGWVPGVPLTPLEQGLRLTLAGFGVPPT